LLIEAIFAESGIVTPCLYASLLGGADSMSLKIGNDSGLAQRKKAEAQGGY
jgi:hypothetical protein